MTDLDSAWEDFCADPGQSYHLYVKDNPTKEPVASSVDIPKSSEIYISTKTQIAHLNSEINLYDVFWKIPIITYYSQCEGIIKKQMKFNTNSSDELKRLDSFIPKDAYVEQHVITHIENPTGRIKFKDVRKISIGLKKSDLVNRRCKKKSAFYNCFVVIIRVLFEEQYKEVHVKVFNTGKLEIPGIKNDLVLQKVMDTLIKIITPLIKQTKPIECIKNKSYTVLINSNFNCGYYVERSKLYEILRKKYRINSSYDACSYPGIQSIFYYDKTKDAHNQTGIQLDNEKDCIRVSFMIFRTGSSLIVGKCNEEIINVIYKFLVKLFYDEYHNINCGQGDIEPVKQKRNVKKKTFTIQVNNPPA